MENLKQEKPQKKTLKWEKPQVVTVKLAIHRREYRMIYGSKVFN